MAFSEGTMASEKGRRRNVAFSEGTVAWLLVESGQFLRHGRGQQSV